MTAEIRQPEQAEDRLLVLEKIRENERTGGEAFFSDVENDPPSRPLLPDEVDYLGKKAATKIRRLAGCCIEAAGTYYFSRLYQIEIDGREHLQQLRGGAIFTSNHFDMFENIAVKRVADAAPGRHRFFKLVREGNYFIPGFVGFLLKSCNTLPLSSSTRTMMQLNRAVSALMRRGDFLLVYPEQAMWWNYKKPRPYRPGAFRYAVRNHVPVVPCFVTMTDQKKIGKNGFPVQKYTIHVGEPLYADPKRGLKENVAALMQQNFDFCRGVYETVYGTKLSYTCGQTPSPFSSPAEMLANR